MSPTATPHLSPTAARTVFLTLTVTRWLPVGLVVSLFTLLAIERGLSVAQATSYAAFSGLVVFALELPTSALADTLGRRPVLLVAGVINVLVALLYLRAQTFWDFVIAAVAMGVYRALDSGPLDAWFVDTVHASDPGADVSRTLSTQNAVLSAAIGVGAVCSGLLIWWHPVPASSALLLPMIAFAGLNVLHLLLTAILLREPALRHTDRPATGISTAVRDVPRTIGSGLNLLRHNRILAGLVTVELFWVCAMTVFETLQPIRLAELLGSADRAGTVMGPAAAAAWGASALGAALIARVADRIGIVKAAIWCRLINGLGAAVMGLMLGPAGLIAAYLFTYAAHGAGGPMHLALLHREAQARNRATVLSMNSMMMFVGGAVAAPLLGVVAAHASTQAAMVTGGLLSLLGAWCYLPALRSARDDRPTAERPETPSLSTGKDGAS